MKRNYEAGPRARSDLHNIWGYIAQRSRNRAVADRMIRRFENEFARLAEMPTLGAMAEGTSDETLRIWPVGDYVIAYRPGPPLHIVRVLSGYQDWQLMLSESES